MNNKNKSFREIIELSKNNDEYEPLTLWLIPIYLRCIKKYYEDAVDLIRKKILNLWTKVNDIYPSFDEFEKTDSANSIWEWDTPYWWGLNDVVGWIDVRLCVRKRQIQFSLFLPTKRISRKLQDKKYGFCCMDIIDLPEKATNEELRIWVIRKLNLLMQNEKIQKLFIDLKPIKRIIYHTDLVGIIKEFALEDWENLNNYERND
jgi:hypothetical protein